MVCKLYLNKTVISTNLKSNNIKLFGLQSQDNFNEELIFLTDKLFLQVNKKNPTKYAKLERNTYWLINI